MRILLLGQTGQLGHELVPCLQTFAELVAPDRRRVDLADPSAVRAVVRETRPDVIVNAAAYTDVDRAEQEPERAHHVNGFMVGLLGEEAALLSAGLVHYSTDFVFDGEKGTAYVETDPPNPISEYGRSKLAGERALLEQDAPAVVFRTAWVYSLRRKSFPSTMLRLARTKETLGVVADQIGNPTFCRDLAVGTALILFRLGKDAGRAIAEARGVYHLTGTGAVSRYDWARAIFELDPRKSEHRVKQVSPIATRDFPLPARRPLSTPLDGTKFRRTWGLALPPWRASLERALQDTVGPQT